MSQQNTQLQTQKTELQEPETKESRRNRAAGIIAIALLALAGLGWFIFDILSGTWKPSYIGSETTEEVTSATGDNNSAVSADDKSTLKALGDSFSGYAPLQDEDFQTALAAKDLTLDYADEPNVSTRIAALGEGKADLIFTSLDQYLTEKPAGKIVALLNQEEGTEPPQVHVAVASQQLLESNPDKVQSFVDTYYNHLESADIPEETDGKVKFFSASEAADWINSGKLKDNIGAVAQNLTNSGQEVDLPEDLGEFYNGEYVTALALAKEAEDNIPQEQADDSVDGDSTVADLDSDAEESATTEDSSTTADSSETSPENTESTADASPDVTTADNSETSPENTSTSEPDSSQEVAQTSPALAESTTASSQSTNASTPASSDLNVLGEIKFPSGSAQLTAQEQQKLASLVTKIKSLESDDITIQVQGHTSSIGSPTANQILSQARAQAVVNYFQSQSLDYKFNPEGFGFSQPIPGTNPTAEVNQRTVVAVVE